MPLLMVKPIGAQQTLKQDHFQASLFDIPKTICAHLLNPQACLQYEGVDLFKIGPKDAQAKRQILVSKEMPKYARQYEGYFPVDIGRMEMLSESIKTKEMD